MVLGLAQPAQAVNSEWGAIRKFAIVNSFIGMGNYRDAITMLEQMIAAEPGDAEAHNLMGFSLRKSGDFDRALGFYQKALAIDPAHLGANEYLGELYLETGERDKAQQQLTVLEGLCGADCEEYLDLKSAMDGTE